jgi:U3 small nucleolar RNA-associated protein 6
MICSFGANSCFQDEIRTIVQKRNDHEHRILSPGNTPSDWSAYAKWEQSLDSLRAKRCRRLKIRHLESAHAGQGRVLGIYERAVNRHTQSSALWREYLNYTASIKAAKRYRKTMTNALRMMPTDAHLWVMAGQRAASNGDMAAARGFFMRGCRFCTRDGTLWLEYARCEMEWLQKVDKRRRKGADPLRPEKTDADEDEILISSDEEDEDDDGTGLMLPDPPKAQDKVIDNQTAQQLKSNPAMDGAIPIAIFDISRKQPFFSPDIAETFFVMMAEYREISVRPKIVQHVLDTLDTEYPNHPSTSNCHIREPILGLDPMTADFPRGLREVLAQLKQNVDSTTDKAALAGKVAAWTDEYLVLEGLDEGIRKVLEHIKAIAGAA